MASLPEPRTGTDRLTGLRVDGVTGVRLEPPDRDLLDRDEGALLDESIGVRLVLGATDRPDVDEGARVDGEDLDPEGDVALPPAEPRPDPDPMPVPPGRRVDRKILPPDERPPP